MSEHPTRLWLGSGSPRRRVLLASLNVEFEIEVPDVDETLLPNEPPADAVVRLATLKAVTIARAHPGDLALGADTLVALNGEPLGKPRDKPHATEMLTRLSGRTHEVWTGVAIACSTRPTLAKAELSRVTFRELSPEAIATYVFTQEPLDKAGAYAIQGLARPFVEKLEGDESNVIGLPLGLTEALLRESGFRP